MKPQKFVFIALFLVFSAAVCISQTKPKTAAPTVGVQTARSSPAYAEVLLRKTELLSDLESLLIEYTEEYPKIKELRFEIARLQKELDRLLAADAAKLSAALGKLMVRKCELDANLWGLQQQFNDQHPDVKRAKRKAEIFETAINDILK